MRKKTWRVLKNSIGGKLTRTNTHGKKALAQFKVTHDLLIELLETKDDEFLSGEVDYREYNFRFLLHGIIQHDIYHIGQIAFLKKLLCPEN
jgi:hypothetical protein